MAQKIIETKKFTHHQESKSKDIDTSKPGLINIDNEQYFVDGEVAKFILELLEELDSYKEQLSLLQKVTGQHGES